MLKISQRGAELPASPIRKLAPLADAARERGVKIYHLNIGQPDIETPQVALDALKNIDRKILEYTPSDGLRSVREKFAEYYRRNGIDLTPDDMIVTAGGSEAILFAFLSCMDPGDEVMMTEPGYANYISFARQAGANVVPIPTHIKNRFALPPIEEFERYITPRTRALMLCNPNNPTGYLYSRAELNRIRDLVKKHDLFLISDEVYREFCYSDEPYTSALQLEGIEENVVMVDSVSKRYSECGIRIGMMVTRNKDVKAAAIKIAQARLCPPLVGQLIAAASVDAPAEYMEAIYREYIARRDFLIEGLNRIPGVFSPMPQGAFYTMASLPVEDADDFCAWLLTDFQHNGATLMMAPGSGFYAEPTRGKNQVRLAYVLNRDDIAVALQILKEALKRYSTSAQ